MSPRSDHDSTGRIAVPGVTLDGATWWEIADRAERNRTTVAGYLEGLVLADLRGSAAHPDARTARRARIRELLEQQPPLDDRTIAKEVRVSHMTVGRYRRELEEAQNAEQPADPAH